MSRANVADGILALARAFQTDPVANYVFRPDVRLPSSLTTFYSLVLRLQCIDWSLNTVSPDGRGACLWQRDGGAGSPRRAGFTPLAQLMFAPHAPGLVGWSPRALLRLLRLGEVVDHAHARACKGRPHYYLAVLGVDPLMQGRGYATALVAPRLAQADREGVLCYLESSKAGNVPMYERWGFQVVAVCGSWEGELSDEGARAAARDGSGKGALVDAAGAPLLWIMTREPREAAAGSCAPGQRRGGSPN
jgi:GNAT superfamily N-acetyltransferase